MKLICIMLSIMVSGCVYYPREPHAGPKELLIQYAPLDRAAYRVCCGMNRHCLPHQSDRC